MKIFNSTVFAAFINQKGGIGKSTLTQCLALTLKEFFGLSVAIIDTDFQKSLVVERQNDLDKIESLKELMIAKDYDPKKIEDKELKYLASVYKKIKFNDLTEVFSCELDALEDEITRLDGKYDMVFIDTPGYSDENIIAVFAYLDLALIPIVMNKKDINSSMDFIQNTVSKVKQIKEDEGENFVYAGVLNKFSNKEENKQIFEFGEVMEMSIFDVGLSNRQAQYDRMTNTLTSVVNSSPDPKLHEVYNLTSKILKLAQKEFK